MTRALALLLALALAAAPALAQQRPQRAPAAPAQPPAPPPEPAPAPYEPQLLRLAEILGALSLLAEICAPEDAAASAGEGWRAKMRDLMEAEGQTTGQRERLAGAFNRGLAGYGAAHRVCTPNSRLALERLGAEGARLAQDIANRYGA